MKKTVLFVGMLLSLFLLPPSVAEASPYDELNLNVLQLLSVKGVESKYKYEIRELEDQILAKQLILKDVKKKDVRAKKIRKEIKALVESMRALKSKRDEEIRAILTPTQVAIFDEGNEKKSTMKGKKKK